MRALSKAYRQIQMLLVCTWIGSRPTFFGCIQADLLCLPADTPSDASLQLLYASWGIAFNCLHDVLPCWCELLKVPRQIQLL